MLSTSFLTKEKYTIQFNPVAYWLEKNKVILIDLCSFSLANGISDIYNDCVSGNVM